MLRLTATLALLICSFDSSSAYQTSMKQKLIENLSQVNSAASPWVSGTAYKEGDQVTQGGKTYACNGWPATGWCSQAAYVPGGPYTDSAWTLVSSGPAPTPTPSGGVSAYSAGSQYNIGDRVSMCSSVFECQGAY